MSILFAICDRVNQRYLLAVMCMLGHALGVMNRQAFSVTMRDMVSKERMKVDDIRKPACQHDDETVEQNNPNGIDEFQWSGWLQLYITSAMSVGMYLGMLPVGMCTDRYGAKTLFGLSVFVPGLCCLVMPICARTSPYIVLFNRLITGTFEAAQYPTVGWLAARWFPARHQGVMLGIVFLGLPLGNSAGHIMYHYLHLHSWASNYYVLAVVSVLWTYLWQVIVWEDPFEHPFITLEELEMLVDRIPMFATDSELPPGWRWPWRDILTSKSLAMLMIGHSGYSFFANFALMVIPNIYFPEIHNFYISKHGGLLVFVDVMMFFTIFTSGFISDKLVSSRWLNTTHVIKTFYSISTILGSLLLLGLVHVGCSTTSAILYYVATVFCLGFGQTNWSHACLHIAPNFVGTTMAISSTLSVVVMPIHLYIEQTFTIHARLNEWKTVSYMNAAASILMAAIFLKWGNCQLRPWNLPQPKKRFEVDYETQQEQTAKPSSSSKVALPAEKTAGVTSSQARLAAQTAARAASKGRNVEEFGVIELTPSMHLEKTRKRDDSAVVDTKTKLAAQRTSAGGRGASEPPPLPTEPTRSKNRDGSRNVQNTP